MKAAACRSRPHRARLLLLRIATVGASVFVTALAGCGDDNPTGPVQPQPKYLPSSTPQNVLENLRRAYTTRDSTGYDSLFDVDYVGTSVDQRDPTPVVLTLTKADERRHISALAQATTAISIDLQFPPNLSRFTDAGDPPGWATVQTSGMILEVSDPSRNSTFLLGHNEVMEFRFKPTTPSPGSPTDTTWTIIRWTEIAQP